MADNVAVTPGSGDTIAADDIAGVKHQRVKVSVGVDGVAADMTSGAGAVSAATPRVTLASDDPTVTALATVNTSLAPMNYVEDAAAAANPSGPVQLLVRTDTPATQVSADGDLVAQRGTNYGAGYVTVLTSDGAAVNTFGGGTQYTEDAAAAADPVGNAVILVRKDTLASEVSTDGDNVAQRGTSKGEAYTKDTDLYSLVNAGDGYNSSATVTCGTTAYAANDAVGNSGASAVLTFATIGPSAGRIMITWVGLRIDRNALISGETSYVLYLYDGSPDVINDSAAWDLVTNDRAEFLGAINIGTPVDLGSTLWVEATCLKPVKLATASTSLYGYLVTVGAYTPTAAVYTVFLQADGR
jgi:hypothetical protein